MGPENINIKVIFHHFQHLITYSIIIWQIYFAIILILRWINRNWKLKCTKYTNNPQQPVINIDGSAINDSARKKSKKDLNAIDVDFKKDIFINEAESVDVKIDEKIKGKVKTQKDKLKKLIK